MRNYIEIFGKNFFLPNLIFFLLTDLFFYLQIANYWTYYINLFLSPFLIIILLGISLGKIYKQDQKINFWKALITSFTSILTIVTLSYIFNFLLYSDYSSSYLLPILLTQLGYVLFTLIYASLALIFHKADQPWWAMLIPIYNIIVMCDIAQKPRW